MIDTGLLKYRSNNTLKYEGLTAAHLDLEYVFETLLRLLENENSKRKNPALTRPFWDSALITLHKHNGSSGLPYVKDIYKEIINKRNGGNELFNYWKMERDKRVAHNLGHGEIHKVGIRLENDSTSMSVYSIVKQCPTIEQIEVFIGFTKSVIERIKEIKTELEKEINIEIRKLDIEEVKRYPRLILNPIRKEKGIPGRV